MRIAVISDTHFGDDKSGLIVSQKGSSGVGPKYEALKNSVGRDNDYLILAGDILDFSVAPYEKAYECARAFFRQAQDDKLAAQYIYLAGNHDADIWHIIQHQRSVINRIMDNKLPRELQHSVAGIIDDRAASPAACKGFTLTDVTPKAEGQKYGGMFLDKIADGATFNFAYPNLYIVTDSETVLVTHGQYLEPYWAILGELVMRIAADDLAIDRLKIEKMIELNFPLNQLACTGVGQAGALTEKVVRPVEVEVKDKDFARVKKYLDRLGDMVGELIDGCWVVEKLSGLFVREAKKKIVKGLENMKDSRYRDDFLEDEAVRARFRRFYDAALAEMDDINKAPLFAGAGSSLPSPGRVIFGHTHQPISWNDPGAPVLGGLSMHNTGGWLVEGDKFVGAEVFKYETGRGFTSESVR